MCCSDSMLEGIHVLDCGIPNNASVATYRFSNQCFSLEAYLYLVTIHNLIASCECTSVVTMEHG